KPSRIVAGAVAVLALLPLIPRHFWSRLTNTVSLHQGTFDVFSFFIRVLGWEAAWEGFLAPPFGVGYPGFRFVSLDFNSLNLAFGPVENYIFETLVGTGIVGFILLGLVVVRLFQLGQAVAREAPPGTLASQMARFHGPFVLSLLVASLT